MTDYLLTWLAGFGIGSALATMLMGWITRREFREWKSLCDAGIELAERYKKQRSDALRELWKVSTILAARSCEETESMTLPRTTRGTGEPGRYA